MRRTGRNKYAIGKGTRLIPLITGLIALALLIGAIAMTWYREGR